MADESIPDWRLLAPHRPLGPGDDAYVWRPSGGGGVIANWVDAGGSAVLVSGPTGVGKSTELAQAANVLEGTHVVCLVQVDRMTNVHRLSADELMELVAHVVVSTARDRFGVSLSKSLAAAVQTMVGAKSFTASGAVAARAALDEVARSAKQQRVALLIDGLEKMLPGPGAREIFEALSQLPEYVDLIVIIPWHAAFGGGTESILRAGERLHRVAALDTYGAAATAAMEFFGRVLAQRLRVALPESMTPLLGRASKFSGGLPRVFLQLVADAGTYARAKRGAPWPDKTDLSDAINDQRESFRRALLPGDTQAIVAVTDTDGRELDLERRVRLLAQGVLLERSRNGHVVLEPHPLVAQAVVNPRS